MNLCETFTENDRQIFMSKLWDTLVLQSKKFSGTDSTSLSVERTHELLKSIAYTLGVAITTDSIPEKKLIKSDLNILLERGQCILKHKLKSVRIEWELMYGDAPKIPNVYFTDTVIELGKFFKQYNIYYEAHTIPCSITYPLLCTVPETLEGISFIEEYIKHIQIENDFLNCFELSTLTRFYNRIYPDYEELLISLSDQVLINAIGLFLVGKDIRKLNISASDRAELIRIFGEKNTDETEICMRNAARLICENLKITDSYAKEYLEKAALKTVPHLKEAVNAGDISLVFMSF